MFGNGSALIQKFQHLKNTYQDIFLCAWGVTFTRESNCERNAPQNPPSLPFYLHLYMSISLFKKTYTWFSYILMDPSSSEI